VCRDVSIVAVVAILCGPIMTRLKTVKSIGSINFEELSRTSHPRARCGTSYRRLSFCNASALFQNFEHFTIYVSLM
jgi:hypothetical protein